MDAIENAVNRLADLAGAPPDPLKVILLLFLSMPLSLVLPKLRAPWTHLYSIGISFFYVAMVQRMPLGLLQLAQMSVATWALCRWGVELQGRSKGREGRVPNGLRWPWIVTLFAMGQLTIKCAARAPGRGRATV